jgi:putative ABC transport system ATP-binding protein
MTTQHATILQATGLTKTYYSTEPAAQVLNGIDLTVHQGEFVAVMGASGSGKSTLLYCISGLDQPTSGSVEFEGRQINGLNDDQLSRIRLTRMGFVFQQAHFLKNLTIRDNIMLPALKAHPGERGATIAHVEELLARFEIGHVAGNGITEVSGGQLQRAAICRALATRPALVFADEPTGALNSAMSNEVLDALSHAHADGTAVVMVTHSANAAARADRVVYLSDGVVIDSLELRRWTQAAASDREGRTSAWLTGHGF